MSSIVMTTYICDRCNKKIASFDGNTWTWHKVKPRLLMKLSHEVPCWNRVDEFLLCDDCAKEFKNWMKNND